MPVQQMCQADTDKPIPITKFVELNTIYTINREGLPCAWVKWKNSDKIPTTTR
ncbi:hypothetical protein ZOSMA_72G00200 [Zostera marina]|uniref:Uncharacterized protein n=1 Tax=Zostera marina TaxID=29655 RepID=A0A0K9NQH4_ZOSMR|nr:hypothetical protein ZOSMA_72G00200 [Zostera marina]